MADARRKESWSHTAAFMALTANVHRNPKKKGSPFSPLDFHPLISREKPKPTKVGVGILKEVFVNRR
jgi:hypothetical protein